MGCAGNTKSSSWEGGKIFELGLVVWDCDLGFAAGGRAGVAGARELRLCRYYRERTEPKRQTTP